MWGQRGGEGRNFHPGLRSDEAKSRPSSSECLLGQESDVTVLQ